MRGDDGRLETLTRHERLALRELLVGATAVAGREFTDADRAELERLVRAAPIQALPETAALHRVAGSVRRGLENVDAVPDDVRARLTAQQQASSLHHLILTGALSEIGDAFDAAGLSWVVMKGPAVASLLYPEVGDRSYGDLDLLVGRQDFPDAMRILEDLGYRHSIRNWARAEEMLAGQVGMTSPTVALDLHWHLHYSGEDRRPFAIDPEAMIDRARRVVVSGVTAPTFDPVDTLLTLAFHAARSDGHRLIWLKDVERAVAVERPDLGELVSRSVAARCAPPVGLILGRARSLLDAEIPVQVVEELTPRSLRSLDRIVGTFSHPVQLHERGTVTRALTRSVRSSVLTSFSDLPARGSLWLRRVFVAVPENETDDPHEKASYLEAVTGSTET